MATMKLEILILLLLAAAAATAHAHNITRILADHPSLSTFNHYLTTTHLADDINRRQTITVCAVDNAAMADLISHQYPLPIIKNILSLHIFADYFGSKKLHQITKGSTTTSSLFQASGEAAGTSGYVNITDMKGGKVGFTPVDSDSDDDQPMATFVKSIEEMPYNISVIQISGILSSPEAAAPVAAPTELNLTSLLSRQGCKSFSDLLTAQGVADDFARSVEGGLTVFCPSDAAVKAFAPSYKNLTAAAKTSLLLYHAVPEYNSLGQLKSNNGVRKTLATEKAKKFDFTVKSDGDDVTVETKVVTATIKGTLIDEHPLAVFKIDKVLRPTELFKAATAAKSTAGEEADAPGPAGDDDVPADENSSSGGWRVAGGGGTVAIGIALVFGVLLI